MNDPRSEDAAEWFRSLTGVPPPVPLTGLRPVKRNVWASHVRSDTKVQGLPQFLSVSPGPDPPAPLRVLGFAGRGVNRHAIYYTLLDPRHDLRLRIPFGGILMDPTERQLAVCEDLRWIDWLHSRTATLPIRCMVRFGLGDREIRLTGAGARGRKLYEMFCPRTSFSHHDTQQALERVFEGLRQTSRASAASTEPT